MMTNYFSLKISFKISLYVLVFSAVVVLIVSCRSKYVICGKYINSNGLEIEIKTDETYVLKDTNDTINNCEFLSKGFWQKMADNAYVINSFSPWELKKSKIIHYESCGSQDSAYIEIVFPEYDVPFYIIVEMYYSYGFFRDTCYLSKCNQPDTRIASVTLAKDEYFEWDKEHYVSLYLMLDALSVDDNFKGGRMYLFGKLKIETIMSDDYSNVLFKDNKNYIRLDLSAFTECNIKNEYYNEDFILRNSENEIYWKGEVWKKI